MNPEQDYAAEERIRGAAKELYEALKLIVALDEDAHPGLSTWHDMRVGADKKAREAIRKAEGR